jgi:hypothetical protein
VHTIDFLSHQDVLDYDLYKLSVLLSPASINDLLLCYQALNKFSNDNNLPTKMMAFNFLRDRCKQLDILAKQPEPLITGKYLFDLGCQDLKLGNMLKHAYDLQLKGFSRADIIKALGIFSK